MKRFRFRPAAVLALRRTEYEAARGHLARAQQERDAARRALVEADAEVARAAARYRDELASTPTMAAIERHRNWMTRLKAGAEACRRADAERQAAEERAAAQVRLAHRRLRVLERFRDRAWRKYDQECRRLEAIEMNQFAIVQFTRRQEDSSD